MNKNIVAITWIFSVIFLVLALQKFIADLLSLEKDLLKTSMIEDFACLATAIGFVVVTNLSTNTSIQFIRAIGIIYMLISLIGFMGMNIQTNYQWRDVVYLNLTSYIYLFIGVILSSLGSNLMNRQPSRLHGSINNIMKNGLDARNLFN